MKRLILLSLLTIVCTKETSLAANYVTPEDAVHTMETAYANGNADKAVETRDFHEEARRMLVNIDPKLLADREVLNKTILVLELAYRKELRDVTFKTFASSHCKITNVSYLEEKLAKVTELCMQGTDYKSIEHLYLFKSNESWRVINLPHDL